MWPWEHLALGYVLYSGYTRLQHGHPPDHSSVLVLAVATQFPDIVDKPLAWSLEVLPTGQSLGHSVFVAVVLVGMALVVTQWRGVPAIGEAVAVGYPSHLLGDLLYPVMRGQPLEVSYLLWPILRQPARSTSGFYGETTTLLREFVTYLGSSEGTTYLLLEFALVILMISLWALDGRPGLRLSK